MTETATASINESRSVTDQMFQSLNLKIDENLHDYMVLIVKIDDQHYLLENLPAMIRKEQLKTFNDMKECLEFTEISCHFNIFLIISGSFGQDYAEKMSRKSNVAGLYIYCMNEQKHVPWAQAIKKIRCITSNTTELLQRLQRDIKEMSGRWSIGEKTFQTMKNFDSEWYSIFLLIVCHWSKHNEDAYAAMFDECCKYYRNNTSMLELIRKFSSTYQSVNAIREYTMDSFLYRIVNHGLRTRDMNVIRKFAPFINDLYTEIQNYYQTHVYSNEQYIRSVYRGQYLTLDEFQHLSSICKAKRSTVTLTTFASASLNPDIALCFIDSIDGHDRVPCLFEIIISDEYNLHEKNRFGRQVFANISSLSINPDEQEILFPPLTYFCVKSVEYFRNLSGHSFGYIALELIRYGQQSCHSYIVDHLDEEKDPQVYNDILDMLQTNARQELKFQSSKWQTWWNNLQEQSRSSLIQQQSLLLTFYNCFTEDNYWCRKGIEIHKRIFRSIPTFESNRSNFLHVYNLFLVWQNVPARSIAIYEEYLKQHCTRSTNEILTCLRSVAKTYAKLGDSESALECYEKLFELTLDENEKIRTKKCIEKLKTTPENVGKSSSQYEQRAIESHRIFSGSYEAEEEQWRIYWSPQVTKKHHAAHNFDKYLCGILEDLSKYLQKREQWYDSFESKIVLRYPHEAIEFVSVSDYRSYFLSAAHLHVSPESRNVDAANHLDLSLVRYRRYLRDWLLFKELETFFRPFQRNSSRIDYLVRHTLNRMIEKISVLITLCCVYILIEKGNNRVDLDKIQWIDIRKIETKQLCFFDLRHQHWLEDFKQFKESTSCFPPIADSERRIPEPTVSYKNPIDTFLEMDDGLNK